MACGGSWRSPCRSGGGKAIRALGCVAAAFEFHGRLALRTGRNDCVGRGHGSGQRQSGPERHGSLKQAEHGAFRAVMQAEVADLAKARRKNVLQEPPDELMRGKPQGARPVCCFRDNAA